MGEFAYFILFLLIVAFLLQVDFIFYIVYVCIGVYAWSRWYTPRGLQRLEVRRRFPERAFYGEQVDVTLEITNRNRLPLPWLQLHESIAVQLRAGPVMRRVLSLGGRKTADCTYTIAGRWRGYYRLGPLRLETGDLFGLFPAQTGHLAADYFTVYPRIIPLSQLGLPSRLPFGTIASRQRLFEDPARPMGVRHFRSGDSLRQINWKVSAHTQELMVRTLEPAISLETAVLLNLHSGDYERRSRLNTVEWAIEVAASLAVHLVNRRQPVGFMTNGVDPLQGTTAAASTFDEESGRLRMQRPFGDQVGQRTLTLPSIIPPRNGRTHLMKILERLARIESDDTISFNQWAPNACLHLSWGVTILAITAAGDEATCHTLHRLVRSGFNPILIVVEPDRNFGHVRQRAQRLGFAAYHVAVRRDLDGWRRPLWRQP